MKIVRIPKSRRRNRGVFIELDKHEALMLAGSLCRQIAKDSPNGEREEFRSSTGEYFSVGVLLREDTP